MFNTDIAGQELSVFKIGSVIEVNGRKVRVRVDKTKNGSHLLYKGNILKNVSVGSYIKIGKGFCDIIAKVDGETIVEDKNTYLPYSSKQAHVARILTVSLLGFFDKNRKFQQGVKELPLINNECFLLTQAEFNKIHSFAGENDATLNIGSLAMEKGQDVNISVDAIFASHIGIFGNTGSGKSYTLAKIYHELFQRYKDSKNFRKNAKFVLLDFNGEYIDRAEKIGDETATSVITKDFKDEYLLSTQGEAKNRLPISLATAHDPEFWAVLLDASEKTQAPFIKRVLESTYWDKKLTDNEEIKKTISNITYYALKGGETFQETGSIINFLKEIELILGEKAPQELKDHIDALTRNLGYHRVGKTFYYKENTALLYANEPTHDKNFREITFTAIEKMDLEFSFAKKINLIRLKLVLQYYSDIFRGFANREHLGPVIKRLETRMPDIEKVFEISETPLLPGTLTVISLKDVNHNMKKVVPLFLCRQLYAEKKKLGKDSFLNIIIDEAHNILSNVSSQENESWKDYRLETFEEIIKEGRKFGVFLTIASQRPSDISETILSQLHNYFLHRLVNNLDIHTIEKAVSYLDKVSFESLPILPTGTCIISGVATQIPVVVGVAKLAPPYEPNSKTMTLNDKWDSTLSKSANI